MNNKLIDGGVNDPRVGPGYRRHALALCLAAAMGTSSMAHALSFELSDGVKLDWDTSLRYASAWRVESQDPALLSNPNGDDGNRNFDKGQIQSRFDIVTEADLQFDGFGAFARGRAYYDEVYYRSNDHDSPATSNNVSVPHNEFTQGTRDVMGSKVEMLDYFLYSDFDIGGRNLNLRLGSQVVSWGESLLVLGGISNAQSHLDITQSNVPGVQLKEIFLPSEQLYGQFELGDNLNVEAYYQWEWEKIRLDAAGSYFQTDDMIDGGGESLIVVPGVFSLARGKDAPARDSGQWGMALRYKAESLNDTEFGLYYINYHDKLPMLNADLGSGTYNLSYAEDIELIGISAGGVVGDTNLGAEISLRRGQPVTVPGGPLGFVYKQANTVQAQVSATHVFGQTGPFDDLSLLAEVGYNRVNGMANGELSKDNSAWGFAFSLTPTLFDVLPGLRVDFPISYSRGQNGTTSMVPVATFGEGKSSSKLATRLTYLDRYRAEISYLRYMGGPKVSKIDDRDFIAINFQYSF